MSYNQLPSHLQASSSASTSSSTLMPSDSVSRLQLLMGSLGARPPSPVDIMDMIPDPEEAGAGEGNEEENIFRDMTFDEILEDLNARFLVNLPREETSLVRVYWQAEQAHWFYEDYLRPLNPLLPSLQQRQFTHLIIASSPLYSHLGSEDYDAVWEEYCRYKRMVPCCGGILVNETGDKCLMVRGWKSSAGWCFPRGKINSEESEVACAIREVEEETGFDLTGLINPKDKVQTQISAQTVTMFLVKGIDEKTVFETQTRKEIGAIEWVPLVDLPTWTGKKGPKTTGGKGAKKFYNVTPFVGPLKKWLSDRGVAVNPKRKNKNQANPPQEPSRQLEPYFDPQHQAPLHTSSADASALDNLFHRFVHKQTLDLEAETASLDNVAGVDNKAGLERLFGNLDVLKSQDEATPLYPTAQQTEQQHDDDALSRLLGGISLPADPPSASHTAQLPSEKQNKLLAMLNESPSPVSAPPQPNPQPIRPHQASLLAVLSPPPQPPVPVSSDHLTINAKPISLPTSPKPPSPSGNQERIKKQRALLEQITAGFDVDMPNPILQGGYQPQSYQSIQSHPAPASGHVTEETAAYPHDRPQGASIAPPPPYEQTANIHQSSPSKAPHHSPKQHGHHQQQMSVEQNRLLSMLQTLPSKPHPGPTHSHPPQPLQYANSAGQAQGYRPVMHPQGLPYNPLPTGLPFGGGIPPHVRDILAQQPSLPNAPQGAFYNVRPMGVPPSVPGGGHNPPVAFGMGVGYQGYPAQQGYQQGHLQHTRQPPNQAQSGPGHVGGPAHQTVQQQLHPRPSPGGPGFHHPVPRPPNASGLLSMLNQK